MKTLVGILITGCKHLPFSGIQHCADLTRLEGQLNGQGIQSGNTYQRFFCSHAQTFGCCKADSKAGEAPWAEADGKSIDLVDGNGGVGEQCINGCQQTLRVGHFRGEGMFGQAAFARHQGDAAVKA